MASEDMIRNIIGSLKSAKHDHPTIDYAGFITSIANRVAGNLVNIAGENWEQTALPEYVDRASVITRVATLDEST